MSNLFFSREALASKSKDDLLDLAGLEAMESGLESVSPGSLALRCDVPAEVTFRYFRTRDDLVEALVDRLLERQAEAVNIWFAHYSARGRAVMCDHVEDLLIGLKAAAARTPGSEILQQALFALPRLAARRQALRSKIADHFADAMAALHDGDVAQQRERLWPRYRVAVDMALSVQTVPTDAMLVAPEGRILSEAARVLRFALEAA
jgi:AcrR family transcriptional regulator